MTDKEQDIRWVQRFTNFKNAFSRLQKYANKENLNELEQQGLIKVFEYTYELAWKTLQDLFRYKGIENVIGPKPVINQAFEYGYIQNGKEWLKMHQSRNLTSHVYNEDMAKEISEDIINNFVNLFADLINTTKNKEGIS